MDRSPSMSVSEQHAEWHHYTNYQHSLTHSIQTFNAQSLTGRLTQLSRLSQKLPSPNLCTRVCHHLSSNARTVLPASQMQM